MSAWRDGLGKQCSCPPDRWPKCLHPWHVEGRHPKTGKRYGFSLALYAKRHGLENPETRGAAAVMQASLVALMQSGVQPSSASSAASAAALGAVTFTMAATTWVDTVVETGDAEAEHVAHVRAYLGRFGRTTLPGIGLAGAAPLTAFTADAVATLYRVTTKGMANSTKHKYRQALHGLLEWSVAQGYLTTVLVPATAKERRKQMPAGEDFRRTRRIDRAEQAELLGAAHESRADSVTKMVALLEMAFTLGGRKGELLAVQWRDLLWNEGPKGRVLFAAREKGARKSKVPRRVPMTDDLRARLQSMRINPLTDQPWGPTDYVLGNTIGGKTRSVEKAWTTIRFRANRREPEWTPKNGLTVASQAVLDGFDLVFHDIRHECALRWHREDRFSLGTISNLLGHKDLSTLRVYLGMAQHDALDEAETRTNEGPIAPDAARVTVKRRYSGQPTPLRVVERKRA